MVSYTIASPNIFGDFHILIIPLRNIANSLMNDEAFAPGSESVIKGTHSISVTKVLIAQFWNHLANKTNQSINIENISHARPITKIIITALPDALPFSNKSLNM